MLNLLDRDLVATTDMGGDAFETPHLNAKWDEHKPLSEESHVPRAPSFFNP
jgi:hypothetical protein